MPNALRLTAPVEKTFQLAKTDALFGAGESYSTVTIRQARRGASERLEDLHKKVLRTYSDNDPGTVTVATDFSLTTLHRLEAFLTMVSCNIVADDGNLLFNSEVLADEHKFAQAWGTLYDDICNEIIEKVHEVNISWAPPKPNAPAGKSS